jgi:hypothetical protein
VVLLLLVMISRAERGEQVDVFDLFNGATGVPIRMFRLRGEKSTRPEGLSYLPGTFRSRPGLIPSQLPMRKKLPGVRGQIPLAFTTTNYTKNNTD